ncbi:hypothetical protein V8C43DRAFT_288130 [Trichoderma afarasin]
MRRAGSIYSSADSLGNIKRGIYLRSFVLFLLLAFPAFAFLLLQFFPLVTLKMLLRLGQRARNKSLNWKDSYPAVERIGGHGCDAPWLELRAWGNKAEQRKSKRTDNGMGPNVAALKRVYLIEGEAK